MRDKHKAKIAIEAKKHHGGIPTGQIKFYDMGQRKSIHIPSSEVKRVVKNGKPFLTAISPNKSKSGGSYSLWKVTAN